ncbi:MAG: hypothetical protein Q9162_005907 [Coniocarpon cinnabarinum]
MTASAKKKKDKKKDFQKTQLKVGKTKPKPANYTDTSFKAKSIVVQAQSLSVDSPDAKSSFVHHVSMLKSHSDSQRADSLAFITHVVSTETGAKALPESAATLIPKIQPLTLDPSSKVRQQLLKLLSQVHSEDIRAHIDTFLLYLHAAMTNLHASIRAYSLDFLDLLLRKIGLDMITHAGGWVKTLSCFQSLMGWEQPRATHGGWSLQQAPRKQFGTDAKAVRSHVEVLNRFLNTGLSSQPRHSQSADSSDRAIFPLRSSQQHRLPQRSNAFAYLDLFEAPQDVESQKMDDQEDRRRVFVETFRTPCLQGIDNMMREGGELGRSAAMLKRTVEDVGSAYEQDIEFG